MLMEIVEQNPEINFLSLIERNNKQGAISSLLHFRFSEFASQPNHDEFVLAVKECLIGYKAAIYFCGDGDVFVVWRGAARQILKQMVASVQKAFSSEMTFPTKQFPYSYYDLLAHGEELRIMAKQKIKSLPGSPAPVETAAPKPNTGFSGSSLFVQPILTTPKYQPIEAKLKFVKDQVWKLASAIDQRRERKTPEILIVEDQTFSRMLLHSSLREQFTVHSTENAKEAVELYAAHAPDIVFLDIELPDGSGHQLADLFKTADPHAFVVMVSAHNQREDVVRAKENGAKAFVLKPYNKQKIFDCIQMYTKQHKKIN